MTGTTLGHYRIASKLGEGGMGVVYRATDLTLGRDVALKLLPPSAFGKPERKERFLREARTASALHHPNLVTIHEVGSVESGDGEVHFIAMELVEGETLTRGIAGKGLRTAEGVALAIQIADGLAAAHAAGVIHRDLKPSNVMVTPEGTAKILDFGLARFDGGALADPHAATESLAADLTEDGSILGTVAYMSPEQAEGKRLDARSDVFSFGSLLYEMLTGQQAFAGETKVSSLSSILKEEPRPLLALLPDAPAELDRIVARCLRKNPQRRWQSIADVRVSLQDLKEDMESGRTAPAPVARPSRRRLAWAAAALAVGLALGAFAASRFASPAPLTFQRLTFQRGDVFTARFAPGGAVVYSAAWDGQHTSLYSIQPGSREARRFDIQGGRIQSISSKGEMAVLLGSGLTGSAATLARVPYSGGAPREILDGVLGASWGPDGEALAVSRVVDGEARLEYPIGNVILKQTRGSPWISVSPDGGSIAVTDFQPETGDYAITVVENGKPRVLSSGWRGIGPVSWSPDGNILFSAARTGDDPSIFKVSTSGKLRSLGQVAGWGLIYDTAPNGDLLMSVVNSRIGIRGLLSGSSKERDLSWQDTSYVYELSRDASRLLFTELSYGEGRNTAIYLRPLESLERPAVRLGFGNRPSLSPDGKMVACLRWEGSDTRLALLPVGAGESTLFPAEAMRHQTVEWFPDSASILYTGAAEGQPPRSWRRPVAGGDPVPVTEPGQVAMRVSPSGDDFVIQSKGSYYLRKVAGGPLRPLEGVEPGESVIGWSNDGRRIHVYRSDRLQLRIHAVEVATGRRALVHEPEPFDPGAAYFGNVAMSADGRWYAASFQRDTATLYLVKGLR